MRIHRVHRKNYKTHQILPSHTLLTQQSFLFLSVYQTTQSLLPIINHPLFVRPIAKIHLLIILYNFGFIDGKQELMMVIVTEIDKALLKYNTYGI